MMILFLNSIIFLYLLDIYLTASTDNILKVTVLPGPTDTFRYCSNLYNHL